MSDGFYPTEPPASSSKRRAGRACDLCRRAKSRCDRAVEDGPCIACSAAGVECTFSGPSFKRGPPKGYIQALEQRWYRSESILAVIMSSHNQEAQALVGMLQQDPMAREVLHSVNIGPLGLSGRAALSERATMEEVMAYLAETQPGIMSLSVGGGGGRRPEKQSRASREEVSSQTVAMSFQELGMWQDRLASYLVPPRYAGQPDLPSIAPARAYQGPFAPYTGVQPLDMSELYSMEPALEEVSSEAEISEAVDAFGHLSMDENNQLRYHGSTSGFNLISREERTDGRNEGGIWYKKLPMARTWPAVQEERLRYPQEQDIQVEMPTRERQEHLITVYFTYIHPWLPLIHKRQFMEQFRSNIPASQGMQTLSKGLLLTMLATAERYCTSLQPRPPAGIMSEAGCDLADAAREVLMRTAHHSHPSICQALILLGIREFAIGSTEQAWLYIGMAVRMAYDLGLNRDPERWRSNNRELFSSDDKQTRRAIWWACCVADRHLSAFLGRPLSIQDSDYDVALPSPTGDHGNDIWRPMRDDPSFTTFSPVPSRAAECFHCSASLSTIMADIVRDMHPVRRRLQLTVGTFQAIDNNLCQWYEGLPRNLQYLSPAALTIAPVHIMSLHVEYWYTVLLLHRAFLPVARAETGAPARLLSQDLIQHLEKCEMAASKISDIVDAYRRTCGLQLSPPFLTSYVLGAGVTHVLLLSLRPVNDTASRGLLQCLEALRAMQVCWPGAELAYALLNGVKQRFPGESSQLHVAGMPGPSQSSWASHDMPDYGIVYGSDPFQIQNMAQMLGIDAPAGGANIGPREDPGGYGYGHHSSPVVPRVPGSTMPTFSGSTGPYYGQTLGRGTDNVEDIDE